MKSYCLKCEKDTKIVDLKTPENSDKDIIKLCSMWY